MQQLPLTDHALLRDTTLVDGEWIRSHSGADFAVTNPANGKELARVPDMTHVETRDAIHAAHRAWPSWRSKTAKERAVILHRWHDLIMSAQDDLATLMTAEQGKPFAEARGEVAYGASFIEWFAEEGKRAYGDVIPAHGRNQRVVVIKQSIGVAAAITPWNFPIAMITRKVGPALAAGCPVVVKPAEDTPLCALALGVLAERAGIPAGVLNLITSSRSHTPMVGKELTSHPLVRKISFTGSTAVGKILMKQCSETVKKVSLELGGNAPFIVFEDADLDKAALGVMASKYRNTGQTCVCANRIYVQSTIYDRFLEKLTPMVSALTVGPGLEGKTEQGPLINQAAVNKVQEHLADAVAKGGRIVVGGKPHRLGGTFFEPTIIAEATSDMQVAQEETFGPLAPIFRFETEEQVIAMANDTELGLASYFYSRDIARIWRVAEALETGMVGVNEGVISTEIAPFGGVKESGIGREGSRYGLDDYFELKYICMGI